MEHPEIEILLDSKADPEAIVAAIEAVPQESLSLRQTLFYARYCYRRAHANNDPKLWKATLKMLNDRKERAEPELEYLKGAGMMGMNRPANALECLERAVDNDPELEEEIRPLIIGCRDYMSNPRSSVTFRSRVEHFWRYFRLNEEKIVGYLDTQAADPESPNVGPVREALLNIFFIALEDVHFYATKNMGEPYEIIFRPEGEEFMMFLFDYILRRVPKLNRKWKWSDCPKQTSLFSLEFLADWKVWLIPEPDGRVEILIASNDSFFTNLRGPMDPPSSSDMFADLWKAFIGEPTYLASISDIRITGRPPRRPPDTNLSRLQQELQRRGLYFASSRDFVQRRVLRWTIPAKPPQQSVSLREDALKVETKLHTLLEQFMSGEMDIMKMLLSNHIVAGFIYYPIGGPADESYRHTVEDMICSAGDDCVTLIGHTEGSVYQYIDFLAWDFEAVIETIQAFFEKNQPVRQAYFHTFFPDAAPVVLRMEPDPQPEPQPEPEKPKQTRAKTTRTTTRKKKDTASDT